MTNQRNSSKEYNSRFFVGALDRNDGWLAATPEVRGQEVYFCVQGATKQDAIDEALAIVKFYVEYKEQAQNIRVSASPSSPFEAIGRFFNPQEVVLAHAC